jgi:hypothetical protein
LVLAVIGIARGHGLVGAENLLIADVGERELRLGQQLVVAAVAVDAGIPEIVDRFGQIAVVVVGVVYEIGADLVRGDVAFRGTGIAVGFGRDAAHDAQLDRAQLVLTVIGELGDVALLVGDGGGRR